MSTLKNLTVDFDSLFPGECISFGSETIEIKPLSFSQIITLFKKSKALLVGLSAEGITLANYAEPQNTFLIVCTILEKAPSFLQDLTQIAEEDINKLPLEHVVNLFSVAVKINLKSKDVLVKNLESLIGSMTQMIQENLPKTSDSTE